jgi:hypothetical protein
MAITNLAWLWFFATPMAVWLVMAAVIAIDSQAKAGEVSHA